MTSDNELRDRIAAAIERGFNESANLNDYEAETLAMAQAIIDELGLHYETAIGGSVEHPNQKHRVIIGKWEKQ